MINVIREGSAAVGLSVQGMVPLRQHATSVYLLPDDHAVVRVAPSTAMAAAARAVALTRWLVLQGLPVTQPLEIDQPVVREQYVMTWWRYYPQQLGRPIPGTKHLGTLLRRLHALPRPPMELPCYKPLASLRSTVEGSSHLADADRCWLLGAVDELLEAYSELRFPLGEGLVHGDAYTGNTLWDGDAVRFGDWDEAGMAPRELDLANTFQSVRYGATEDDLRDFVDAYGYDPRTWPGHTILTRMRDFHTLGAFIRRSDRGEQAVTAQLYHRLGTLKQRRDSDLWTGF
ncbi:phosphotransferase family protein [Sinosporangium siamense]|uniref:Aminoglycoside phosphotransferase n=1 Tax=Sinosporangium siamense TaxID=1367973 RepID=A0A919VBD4_9ACTN|nr:phosphotransferase [Sinosporangium siamense]GII96392.1 aminoglycoside phosphotransferase [Sinosporangium siamense]